MDAVKCLARGPMPLSMAVGALIVVTWPKVKNGLGFPARAFAILP